MKALLAGFMGSKFLKFFSGWKLYAVIALGALSVGFYGGVRWEKGANADALAEQIETLRAQADKALVDLNKRWEAQVENARITVEDWSLQNEQDNALMLELLAGQADIRKQFDDLNREIIVTTDFGTCTFSPDAIRLLKQAGDRATASSVPRNRSDSSTKAPEKTETPVGDG